MGMTVSGSSGLTFPDSSAQTSAGLGYGQTWQDVKASRALATTYTNSTNKPIIVSVYTSAGGQNALYFVIDGFTTHLTSGATVTYEGAISGVVPPGSTYRINYVGGVSVVNWREYR